MKVEQVAVESLAERLRGAMHERGARLGLLSAHRMLNGKTALYTLVLFPKVGETTLWESPIEEAGYRSITLQIPQAHWFERLVYDMYGVPPLGHPRLKSVILHEAWPQGFHPLQQETASSPDPSSPRRTYSFMTVGGAGVYEIPVGPIHAIIEPGHFRFSCLGEIIENLEIRLGYQHRGVEERMTRVPWKAARFVAEAISSDTAVGNALAHALAIEQMLDMRPPQWAEFLRSCALELERLACHVGDLGGVCADIGFSGGASVFGRLRGAVLGLGERFTGSRFMTAYVVAGGVARPPGEGVVAALCDGLERLRRDLAGSVDLLLDNATALDRMSETGRLKPTLAESFGLVGPAGRASQVAYDVRGAFPTPAYRAAPFRMAVERDGDVLARVRVRCKEIDNSIEMARFWLENLSATDVACPTLPPRLPAHRIGVGLVEAWRGELIHLIRTDRNGHIRRYCIKDPSFNNWTGLAIAVRGQLVADFPLCNKSFSLSYSGNDL